MPGIGNPIVIGGGIALGTPAVIGNFLKLSSITPPAGNTSARLIERASSIEILGDGTNSTAIGNNADANGTENIVIGHGSSSVGGGSPSDIILIGQAVVNTGAVSNQIIIGHDISSNGNSIIIGAITSPANFSNAVCIGLGMTHSGTVNGVIIGDTASTSGTNATAIGNGAGAAATGVSIGSGANQASTNANTILIGQGSLSQGAAATGNLIIGSSAGVISATSVANVIFIGHNLRTDQAGVVYASGDVVIGNNNVGGLGFSSRVIWFGDLHTAATAVPAAAMRWKNAAGTDIAAGSITITAPRATGNAVGGSIVFQTGPAGASSAVLQTATTRLTISPNGVSTFGTPTASAENIVLEGFGGAGVGAIRFNNLTNGAGASAGTLANAPSVGNPSFWIPVSIAGLTRFIPAWT